MRKQHLIKHPPSRSMSERGEVRLLTKQLRKFENAEPTPDNIKLMLRLSQRIGKLRDGVKRRKNPPALGRPVGRPKKVQPVEPVVKTPLEIVLEQERQRRETPEPAIVFEHARRAEVKAEIKKEREAIENLPITAPQSDVLNAGDGITPPELAYITKAAEKSARRQSIGNVDLQRMLRPLEPREAWNVPQRYEGCDFDPIRQEVAPPAEPVESVYLNEWNCELKNPW